MGDIANRATGVVFKKYAPEAKVPFLRLSYLGVFVLVLLSCHSPSAMSPFEAASGKPITVAVPLPSNAPGVYTTQVDVSLGCTTSESSVHYTLDGSDPTQASSLYSTALQFTQNTTLRAKAFRLGFPDSGLFNGTYTIQVAKPTPSIVAGSYSSNRMLSFSCADTVKGAAIYYTTDGSSPLSSATRLPYSTEFSLAGNTAAATNYHYRVAASRPQCEDSEIYDGTFTIDYNQTSTPTPSPAAGSYLSDQSVSLSSDSGSTVYYTLDGSDPSDTTNAGRIIYSSAISLTGSNSSVVNYTLKTFATKAGFKNSAVGQSQYSIRYQGSIPSGSYSGYPVVAISPNWDNNLEQAPSLNSVFTASVQINGTTVTADSYQWYLDGTAVGGQTASTASFSTTSAKKNCTLSCVVTYHGYSGSSTITADNSNPVPFKGSSYPNAPLNTVAVLPNKDVYVARKDGVIWVFDPTLTTSKPFNSGLAMDCRAAIASDGTIFQGTQDSSGSFFFINASGATISYIAKNPGQVPVNSSPAVDSSDNVYVGTSAGMLYKYDKAGNQLASYDNSGTSGFATGPILTTDGRLIIVGTFKTFIFNASNLSLIGSYLLWGSSPTNPVVLNGTLAIKHLESPDYYVTLFDASNPNSSSTMVRLTMDDPSYAKTNGYYWCAVSPTSLFRFSTRNDFSYYGNLTVEFAWACFLNETTVLACDSSTKIVSLYHFNFTQKKLFKIKDLLDDTSQLVKSTAQPCIAPDGTIYLSADNNYVYGFTGVGAMTIQGWPQLGKNARHTGNEND